MSLPVIARCGVPLCGPTRAIGMRLSIRSMSTSSALLRQAFRPVRPLILYQPSPGKSSVILSAARLFSASRQISNPVAIPAQNSERKLVDSDDATSMSNEQTEEPDKVRKTTRPAVAYHLFFCAALVYLIIVVGGLTRLTESGLSITEWNPGFKGMRMPWTDAEWDEEWEKYKRTPEWAILNRHMTVDDFKKIYMWEWSHRIIGRIIGVAFVVPCAYFVLRRQVARGTRWKLLAIALGIGFQGALGWFMVQSGLTAPEASPPAVAPSHPHSTSSHSLASADIRLDGTVSNEKDGPSTVSSDWHPRVSHFRLAAHLGTAFLVYVGMIHTGMAIMRDHYVEQGLTATAVGRQGISMTMRERMAKLVIALSDSRVGRLRNVSRGMFCLTFLTAMTGALVAGLDAGLVYSEFPYMGDGLVPPSEELLDERYTWRSAKSTINGLVLGNVSQNPVTVQLIHRCLAITTLCSALGLAFYTRRVSLRMLKATSSPSSSGSGMGVFASAPLPRSVPRLANLVAFTAVAQASLGIFTLIYLVPIQLASAHQAGSVALLTSIVALLAAMRRPNSKVLQTVLKQYPHRLALTRQQAIDRAINKVVRPNL